MMSQILAGKVAIITGGTRGLGLAIATEYARAGASVVVASRSQAAVDSAVERLRESGAQASGIACNASDLAQVQSLAAHAIGAFGRIDLWVNNAGISGTYGPTLHLPPERFMEIIQTNIVGVYYGSITAMDQFIRQGSGKLINLLGRGDRRPVPLQNAYASSKAWVRSFTLALAKEYQHSGIGVYAFNPGLVLTELLANVDVAPGYEGRVQGLEVVMRLWANPPEVAARKALWLASPATDGRTGLEIHVLTPARMASGVLREAWRRIQRRPAPSYHVNIRTVE